MATPERGTAEFLRRLREQLADPRAALAPATPDCPDDGTLAELAGDDAPSDDLLRHLRVCARCAAIAALLRDDSPAPAWAVAATREATRRWMEERDVSPVTALVTALLAWLPGAPAPQLQPAAAYGARPEPAIITVEPPGGAVTVDLRTSAGPIAEAEVTLVSADSGARVCAGRAGADGRVKLESVAPGRYHLEVTDYAGPLKILPPD